MNSVKVMIVEDNTLVAQNLRECVEGFGFTVTSTTGYGEAATANAEIENPDIVLMDVKLRGEMDGVEAAEEIYSNYDIPVIFLSAYSDNELLQRAKQTGSFGYLIKPYDERELYAMIELVLYKAKYDKERRKLEKWKQELKQMESIGVLAGGIAHDFNNLLFVILGNIENIEKDIAPNGATSERLNDAKKAIFVAKDLTEQLLTFSKGGQPARRNAAIDELLSRSVNFVLLGSSVKCNFHFPENLWQADIDTGQISRVIQNIVLNACHAMPKGGVIDVECWNYENKNNKIPVRDGNYIKIVITDQGIGISPDIIDQIFDPYFTTKGQYTAKGSGLGLAICHSIIKKHDGHIEVDSEINKGTTFTLYLPASDKTKAVKKREEQEDRPSERELTILLMDDEEMIRTIVQDTLERLGHKTITVADGEQAVATYKEHQEKGQPFDLTILDLTIPGGVGGKDTAAEIVQIDPDAKIIITSGYCNDPVMVNYHDFGFAAQLAKPFTKTQLQGLISKIIEQDKSL